MEFEGTPIQIDAARKLADDIVENEIKLTEFESNFVKSCIKICRSKGTMWLSESQLNIFEQIKDKVRLCTLDKIGNEITDA